MDIGTYLEDFLIFMDYYRLFFAALILTIVIETMVMALVLKSTKKNILDVGWNKIIFTGFLASFATLPYLWFLWPMVFPGKYMIASGEIFVTIIEIVIIRYCLPINWRMAVLLSFVCNLCSYLTGKIIF